MGGCNPPCLAKRRHIAAELRAKRITGGSPLRIMSVGDFQTPYQDPDAIDAAVEFAEWWKPDVLVAHGDVWDFYELSVYEKNPERTETLQDEIDEGRALLQRFVDAAPKAKRYFLIGNHEDRLRKYLWKRAPELSTLRSLQFEALTGLDSMEFEVRDYGEPLLLGDLAIVHGDIVRKYAGYSAKAMMLKLGVSVAHGHTHRIAEITQRTFGGVVSGFEMGCLADMSPEYLGGVPDWNHGFGIGMVDQEGHTEFQTVRIHNGRIMYAGRVFGK